MPSCYMYSGLALIVVGIGISYYNDGIVDVFGKILSIVGMFLLGVWRRRCANK